MKAREIRTATNWLVTPDKFLTSSQVQALRVHMETRRVAAVAAEENKAVRDAALVEVLLGTGLRVSEACGLLVGDLFLERGGGNVLVRRGKGGKRRLVAISQGLVGYLSAYIEWKAEVGESADTSSPVFLSERRCALSRYGAHRVWKAALEGAGLPTRFGVHATRHSYAVEVYRKTRDLRLTQRLLGHASPATTQIYANLLDDDVRAGVERVWTTFNA